MGRWVVMALAAPLCLSWGLGALLLALGLAHDPRWEGPAVLSLVWRPWVAKRWRYSTTLGRVIVYQPGGRDDSVIDSRTERHEHVHVRQVEDVVVHVLPVALVVALTHAPLLGLLVWVASPLLILLNYGTAALRYGPKRAYLDAEHERSAYAQTDLPRQLGMSWQEARDLSES